MPKIRLEKYSYRYAEQIINSKLQLKNEIESIILSVQDELENLSRPKFNELLEKAFLKKDWESQPHVFEDRSDPSAKLDFYKNRIGIEVQFGHSSFIGIDLLKFQVASYSNLDTIDIGVYIVSTKNFQKIMQKEYIQKWNGSLNFEKVVKYLPHFKSAIQIPIYVIGIDL
ncbi:BglII/BstYI family type II restriction endonuclease [Bacteroidota bacterium]